MRSDEIRREWREKARQENMAYAISISPWNVEEALISQTHPSCGLTGDDIRHKMKFHNELPDWQPTCRMLSTSADSRHKSRFIIGQGFEYYGKKYIVREKHSTGDPWREGTVYLLIEEAV